MAEEQIGDYEIVSSLGKGGFGSVYKARAANGNLVALKVLNPQVLDNQKVVKKFFHEAMILAKLDHPNICRLIEFFPDGQNYAIVMEYVEGTELKELMQQQPNNLLPFDQAFRIAKQSLSAFQYAHENGILHRDIKPANIMIDKQGNSKIMDFGIAKVAGAATHDTAASMLSIHYTPPERFDPSKTVDTRSDVYALGLVFYEMFAGKRPFDVDETSQIMFWHLNEIPEPVDTYVSGLPEEVVSSIDTALEKDPDDRFQDFKEFDEAMGEGTPGVDYSTPLVDNEATVIDDQTIITSAKASSEIKHKKRKKKGAGLSGAMVGAIAVGIIIVMAAVGFFAYKQFGPQQQAGDIISEAEEVIPDIEGSVINDRNYPEIVDKLDGSTMVFIPAGPFEMGSEEPGEEPIQIIDLDAYFIDKNPVSVGKFKKFVEAKQYETDAEKNGGYVFDANNWTKDSGANWRIPNGLDPVEEMNDLPVTQISYNDAIAYCQWCGKDLPTEAQWEKAARYKSGNKYPWGPDEPSDSRAYYARTEFLPTSINSHPEGQSGYGVFGMAGNVYQWCKDYYKKYSVQDKREGKNPTGPASGEKHVLKGGSFVTGAYYLRSASRISDSPDVSKNTYGFRCAKKYEEE
jgi:serine/threonine protein kinase/formylglycine-generating enzyme required for sulfatase activity